LDVIEPMKRSHKALLLFLVFPLLFPVNSCAPRKTKTSVDRVYELDPSGRLYIHPRLVTNPPRTLAVLPFRSLVGEGRVMGSQKLFLDLNGEKEGSPMPLAEQMRFAFYGQIAQLPFEMIHPSRVDSRLKAEGLTSWDAIKALGPEELGDLLAVDGVIFGEVVHLDYIYGILYTQLAAGLRLEMISTASGETLWRFKDTRRDHTVRVAHKTGPHRPGCSRSCLPGGWIVPGWFFTESRQYGQGYG
jgi:hypothetical protein